MLFINYKINAPVDEVTASLEDCNTIVDREKLETSKGRPKIHFTQKAGKLKMQCEMTNTATRDRDFKLGTAFHGKITEENGVTHIIGIVLTAPIYHLVLLCFFAYFIYLCVSMGGFSVVPICLLVFDVFMFWREFKKQGIIKRYIFGALRLTYRKLNPVKNSVNN